MTKQLTKDTAIAYREFDWEDNPNETVLILIGKPYQKSDHEWCCPYRITGAGRDFSLEVCGVDGVQALQLAFFVIDSVLADDELRLLLWGEPFLGFCHQPHTP
ncbi:MAG: hypothetical protein Q4B88_02590 [Moraxella sp.]|nr:hypothetical protein [Moraxella sp.]